MCCSKVIVPSGWVCFALWSIGHSVVHDSFCFVLTSVSEQNGELRKSLYEYTMCNHNSILNLFASTCAEFGLGVGDKNSFLSLSLFCLERRESLLASKCLFASTMCIVPSPLCERNVVCFGGKVTGKSTKKLQ